MREQLSFRDRLENRLGPGGSKNVLKYLIVFGVLLVSSFVGFMSDPSLMLLGVGAVVGMIVLLVFLRQPPIALAVLVFASLLVPNLTGSAVENYLNISILLTAMLLGLWLFDMIARKRSIGLVPSRTNLPLVLFLMAAFLAFLNGQINYYALAQNAPVTSQGAGLMVFVLSAGAFVLVANQVKDIIWLKRLTWLFLGLAGFYIFGRLTHDLERVIRPLFQYGSDASLFWIWLVALCSSQLLLNKKLEKHWRLALALLLGASFYVGLVQAYAWKSGWLPAAIALLVVAWVGFPRFRVPIIIVGSLVALFNFTGLDQAVTGGEDYSILTRVEAWRIVLEIAKVNPVLGLGPSNYYWYTPLFSILGYSGIRFSSHNNYVDIFAQTGILGLILFLWFAAEVAWLAWRLKDRVPEGFAKAYVIGVFGGWMATLATGMLGDWIIPFVYNVGLVGFRSSVLGWLFIGGLVALEQIYGRPREAKQLEQEN